MRSRLCVTLKRVIVWSRTGHTASQLADRLQPRDSRRWRKTDLGDAVAQADIISCATLASEPVLKGAWLRPGQHVDLIGSYAPHMREADDEAIRRSQNLD